MNTSFLSYMFVLIILKLKFFLYIYILYFIDIYIYFLYNNCIFFIYKKLNNIQYFILNSFCRRSNNMLPMQQRIRSKVRRSIRSVQSWNRELQFSTTLGTSKSFGAYSLSKNQPKRYIQKNYLLYV